MSILIYFATIFWSLFPNLIHVFQGGDNYVDTINETNLVVNSDLRLDTDHDGVPDGFTLIDTTANSFVNGVFTFTPIARYGRIQKTINYNLGDIIYYIASVKSDSNLVELSNNYRIVNSHTGSNDFEFLSGVDTMTEPIKVVSVRSVGTADFTPVSVAYIGVYNVSTMINNGLKSDDGVLFTDLTNEEIRLQLDKWINDYGDLTYKIDNTYDRWFHTGFVEKTAERDFIDYLGYFFWLMTPPIILFATLDLIRRVI